MRKTGLTYRLILAATLRVLWGCSQSIEVDVPLSEPVVVVDGWIESDGFAEVFLTQSFPVVNHFDSASILKTFLNFARVELFDDEGNSEVLTLKRIDTYFPPFVYKTTKMKGKAGHHYRLEIKVKGQFLTAESSIPDAPRVNFFAERVDADRMKVKTRIMDDGASQDFYFYKTQRWGRDAIFKPSLNSTFSDILFNGQQYEQTLQKGQQENLISPDEDDRQLKPDEFLSTDTVLIRFACIDQTSFDVLHSTFFAIRNGENPFQASGTKAQTNIVGGLGHFTGLGTVKGSVWLTETNP